MVRTHGPGRARGRYDDLVYEPDPLGRVGKGRWLRRGDPRAPVADNPDAAVERLRAAWRDGALDPAAVPDDPWDLSDLDASVGPNGRNDKLDVAKVETLLAAGAFDLAPTDGPTGNFSDRRADAIRGFEHANGLRPDGMIEPGGETHRALAAAVVDPSMTKTGQSKSLAVNSGVGALADSRSETAPVAISRVAMSRKARIEGFNRQRREQIHELTRPAREGLRPKLRGDTGPVSLQELERRRGRRGGFMLVRRKAFKEIESALGQRGTNRPVMNMEESRQWSILNNRAAKFEIKKNPQHSGAAPPWRDEEMGMRTVALHDRVIEREARAAGVNPDLIRAIMYVENADGNFLGLNELPERFGLASSILPMNINPKIWSGIGGVRKKDFEEPGKNIRAAVSLVKAIQERLPQQNRTPEMIGSIWNFAGAERVNEIGARIQKAFNNKLWKQTYQ